MTGDITHLRMTHKYELLPDGRFLGGAIQRSTPAIADHVEKTLKNLSRRLPPDCTVNRRADDVRDKDGRLIYRLSRLPVIEFTWLHPTGGPLLVMVPLDRAVVSILQDAIDGARQACTAAGHSWPDGWPITAPPPRKRL